MSGLLAIQNDRLELRPEFLGNVVETAERTSLC